MDALARLGTQAVTLLVQATGIILSVVVAWRFFMVVLSGGNERELGRMVRTLLVLGIAIAVVTHIPQTVELVTTIGGAIFSTVTDAVRGAQG